MSCVRRLWNSRGKLSHRLTRSYALLFAAITVMLSLCVYFVSKNYLIGRLRDDLTRSAINIAEVYQEEVAEGHSPDDPGVLYELNSDENVALALVDVQGQTLSWAAYFALDTDIIPDCVGKGALYTQDDGLPLLAQGAPVTINGEPYATLTVIRRVDREYAFLRMLMLLLAVLDIAGAIVALAAGRVTAGRMLSPLSDMIRRAREIDAKALEVRLAVPSADDELRLLAETLNAMLDRVQDAFVRQSRFTSDASHELRTPLAVLQGNVELLARWGKDEPDTRDRCIATICRQVDYMNHLVENLLFLSRGDQNHQLLQRERFDLADFLGEIIGEKRDIDPNHRYTLDCADGIALSADPTLLRQLLFILLDNAAKYTGTGKGIHLLAETVGQRVRIIVCDEGCGVPEAQLDKIFERFYRVDKARARADGGSGLGLAIASTIVKLHGGAIHAENVPTGGLRVIAEMPMA